MTTFKYAAKGPGGKTVEGTINANDRNEAVAELREGRLRNIDYAIRQIRCRHRTRMRKAGNANAAILTQQHFKAAEASGVFRDVPLEAIEKRIDDCAGGARLRQIESARNTIRIVAKID